MKTIAIIQARLSSSRLPGKVLRDIAGEPMLARVLARVGRAKLIDQIVVATTSDEADNPIADYGQEMGFACFRGDPYDVLDRFYLCAKQFEADLIVRITADCPMIAPEEIDRVIKTFLDSGADFATNRLPPPFERTSPIGMDTEVCSFAALERAWKEADQTYQREHVMPYLYDTDGRFKVVLVNNELSLGNLRFTVDTAEDLQLANKIYQAFDGRDDFTLEELLAENAKHPEWQAEVAQIKHKNLYEIDQRAKMNDKNEVRQAVLCPLCGSENQRSFEKVESFGFPIEYLICEDCGFVFQNTLKSQAADPDFYQQAYRKIYQETEEPTGKDLYQQSQRALVQAAWLKTLGYSDFERILDIGASSGLLLETFAKEFKAEVVGVEPGDAYRRLAENKGLKMFSSIDSLIESRAEKFDLVSLMHVLEHLKKPIEVLEQIREKLLKDDGQLIIEVPNFYAHDSYELAHLSCFTEQSLAEMLKQAGFETVAARKQGMPRSKILPLYLTILVKPKGKTEKQAVKAEKNVRCKRNYGLLKRKIQTILNPGEAWLPVEGK